MSANKISVAMTTYNGEKYLINQLDSLFAQSRSIDELIICDDGSIDCTEEIILRYISDHCLEDKCYFYKNSNNLGAMKNFIHTALLCTGDIVFFCDQDDIWDKNKVQLMEDVFNTHLDALVVSCSEVYMNENGELLNDESKYHRESDGFKELQKISFSKQIKTMHSPGLTLAFKRSFIEETMALTYDEDLTYDISMGLVASLKGGMYRLYKPLVYRRIHDNNYSKPELSLASRVENYEHHILGRELQLHHMKVLDEKYHSNMSCFERICLKQRIKKTEKAISYLKNKQILGLAMLCFTINPMENWKLNIGNLLIAYLSKHQKIYRFIKG